MVARTRSRQRLDLLFSSHVISAVVCGIVCIVCPRAFLWFLHETKDLSEGGYEVADIVIRIYGALIFGQAWLVYNTRKSGDASARKAFVETYFAVFALTSFCLCHAQVEGHFSHFNWLNIAFFALLSASYGYFAFFEKVSTFHFNDSDIM